MHVEALSSSLEVAAKGAFGRARQLLWQNTGGVRYTTHIPGGMMVQLVLVARLRIR